MSVEALFHFKSKTNFQDDNAAGRLLDGIEKIYDRIEPQDSGTFAKKCLCPTISNGTF